MACNSSKMQAEQRVHAQHAMQEVLLTGWLQRRALLTLINESGERISSKKQKPAVDLDSAACCVELPVQQQHNSPLEAILMTVTDM
jgi:hypothetical protein